VQIEEDGDGRYGFTSSTIDELGRKFSLRPDIVLMDYGYVKKKVLDYWLDRHRKGYVVTASDLQGQILTPAELASAIKALIAEGDADSAIKQNLQRNLLDFSGTLILYTMTSSALIAALGEVESRRSRVDSAFPHAQVQAIDTKYELYNGDEFAAQKHEPGFYAHLVGVLIDRSVQIGMLETMLEHARGLKYLRYRRSMVAVGAIVAVGGGVAAVAEFLGSRVGDFMLAGDYWNAIIASGFALIVAFVMGALLPFAFGTFMSGLVGHNNDGQE
jgi:hypothetical protein